ncbi:hypothetical protein Q4488_09040 [Amphritea sp. 1_MG-2023]|uniref:hypothetical protein n=1 Tax=Amphritea sp. 1_MG-2023 TaxID=3062670 RepID=UPI0026E3B27E|nr:hypothetical protein [Amphritea sp. 1_MG-2023]MDO6563526.1 hypothetical protein [Amphritea sp. 1_MG-2023]
MAFRSEPLTKVSSAVLIAKRKAADSWSERRSVSDTDCASAITMTGIAIDWRAVLARYLAVARYCSLLLVTACYYQLSSIFIS